MKALKKKRKTKLTKRPVGVVHISEAVFGNPSRRGLILSVSTFWLHNLPYPLCSERLQRAEDEHLGAVQNPVHWLSALLVTSNLHDALNRLEAAHVCLKEM